jgi:hypothetical protein
MKYSSEDFDQYLDEYSMPMLIMRVFQLFAEIFDWPFVFDNKYYDLFEFGSMKNHFHQQINLESPLKTIFIQCIEKFLLGFAHSDSKSVS